jgi:uncharacterized protein (DUF433 family)
MSQPITIIDRGRGPQLSTSRITVLDLVPYFQDNCSADEILRQMPVLTRDELAVVERYYRENRAALDEQDRRIRERAARRRNSPEVEAVLRRGAEKMAALREEFQKRKPVTERNGDHAPR